MGKMIRLKGPGLNDYFAERLVREYGADVAMEKTCGPAREAVERAIANANNDAKDHAEEILRLHG